MNDRIALVVQRDAETRSVVSEALSMFSPGYHVTTASDLATATDWMVVLEPDLVVLGSDVDELSAITEWLAANEVDIDTTVVVGSSGDAEQLGALACVHSPLQLSELMSTVNQVAGNTVSPNTAVGRG
jgi:DNA-binding response OmpR family regulator